VHVLIYIRTPYKTRKKHDFAGNRAQIVIIIR